MRRLAIPAVIVMTLMFPRHAHAHNEATHRDITAYAFEIMSVARNDDLNAAFAGQPELTQFLTELSAAATKLGQLPPGLPTPPRDRCIDPDVRERFGIDYALSFGTTAEQVSAPIDVKYSTVDKSCGVDAHWRTGTLYRRENPSRNTHAGNVLGFWAAHPDHLEHDVTLEWRPTNIAGLSHAKEVLEVAAAAAVGTVWVPIKCFTKCASALLELDFDECGDCIEDAVEKSKSTAQEGVATVDGLAPGFGEIRNSEFLSGMCHHIDVKGDVPAPGWSTLTKPHYDDISGMYSLTAGPGGVPGVTELAAHASALIGATVNYEESHGVKNYEVGDGKDFHQNTTVRTEQQWEYLPWPNVPFTPVDNLSWFGWNQFKRSVETVRADPRKRIETRYLGWALHGLGDATVPMHVTGTFAWGHRPYEDAIEQLGRPLLGEFQEEYSVAIQDAVEVVKAAYQYRKTIVDWRIAHPDRGNDIPIRDMVTTLATKTFAAAGANPAIYDDGLSTAYNMPVVLRGEAIEAYKVHRQFMRERLQESVAATIAFLLSASEVLP